MKVREKYCKIFGEIKSLDVEISWSTGVSNMLEWLTWSTQNILGISKTELRKQIVEWADDEKIRNATLAEKQKFVENRFIAEIESSEKYEKYAKPEYKIATPREVLRRTKYFSEDYLNKEFDIFWGLASDLYLDQFYSQFTKISGGGRWFSHGNSGLFTYSTNITSMAMDNLSYNPDEKLLVANELKLGGRKNKDQILKYALMFRRLKEGGFIANDCRFLLLFIADTEEKSCWEALIEEEIDHCISSMKSTAAAASDPVCVEIARAAEYACTTWKALVVFNAERMKSLDLKLQQVEQKLLKGFNEALLTKNSLRNLNRTFLEEVVNVAPSFPVDDTSGNCGVSRKLGPYPL